MSRARTIVLGTLAMLAGVAVCGRVDAQTGGPHVGYVYPAGAQQGTLLHVIVAGQQVRQATGVHVSGAGVHASIVRPVPMTRKFEREELPELRKRLGALRADPRADSTPLVTAKDAKPDSPSGPAARRDEPKKQADTAVPAGSGKVEAKPAAETPKSAPETKSGGSAQPAPAKRANASDVPIEELGLRELECYLGIMRTFDKRQTNAQLADGVLLEIRVDAGAEPGDREIRLVGPAGLSNPMRFQVGSLPEVYERETLGRQGEEGSASIPVPCVVNGQVMPGDADRFTFAARKGQRLVIDASARRLVPYLADAVPGWFEPVISITDATGREVAFADQFRVNPDPTLLFEAPESGEYRMEVRDALYRGREDFVYRIAVGELPFVTQVFPLGTHTGINTTTTIEGWNLSRQRAPLAATPAPGIRSMRVAQGKLLSNDIVYAVDDLPEMAEPGVGEGTPGPRPAVPVTLPRIVNGRIDEPGEVDVYRFEGRGGQEVVAEVCARRLYSRLDSRLTIIDPAGNVLAGNDDMDVPGAGLLTYNADSYLRVRLPASGAYLVKVADAGGSGGGPEYPYRLRLSAPRPSFEVRVTPSSLNLAPGRAAVLTAHVLRKDGFDGEVELSVAGNGPGGFALQGARVPPGRDSIRFTITASQAGSLAGGPAAIAIEGRATVGSVPMIREATPADDMMQAFIYHHLVPAQELLVQMVGPAQKQSVPPVSIADTSPVRITPGGDAEIRVRMPVRGAARGMDLALLDPPAGISLASFKETADGLSLVLRADAKTPVGLHDNIIVAVYREPARAGADAAARRNRQAIGCLPAIAMEVVGP